MTYLTFITSFGGGGTKLCLMMGTESGMVMLFRKEEMSCNMVDSRMIHHNTNEPCLHQSSEQLLMSSATG